MPKQKLTREIAWAIARDEADRAMKADGRTIWNGNDCELATKTFNRLWPKDHDIRGA